MSDRFSPQCGHCAALCCVAFAFDRSADFSHDKPADRACRHLNATYRCTIHPRLAEEGYAGCVRFDCLGAGQRVTEEVFGGGDWRKDPALVAPMSAAFRVMRRIHELLRLLDTAKILAEAAAAESERQRLVAILDPTGGWTHDRLADFDKSRFGVEVWAFLRSLAGKLARG